MRLSGGLSLGALRTVAPEDMIDNDGQNTGDIRMYKTTVAMGVAYSPQQRWYYFPRYDPGRSLTLQAA